MVAVKHAFSAAYNDHEIKILTFRKKNNKNMQLSSQATRT